MHNLQELQIVKFKVIGVFPLLTNNPASMAEDEEETKPKPKPKNKNYGTPEEQAKKGLYLNEKGNFCIPSCAFRASILNGAKNYKIGKNSAISILQASIFNVDELSILFDPETEKPLKKFSVDSRRVIIQKQGIIRHRPKFEKWGCFLHLQIDPNYINAEIVKEYLNIAGTKIGVGDFRVEKKGSFGKFFVKIL